MRRSRGDGPVAGIGSSPPIGPVRRVPRALWLIAAWRLGKTNGHCAYPMRIVYASSAGRPCPRLGRISMAFFPCRKGIRHLEQDVRDLLVGPGIDEMPLACCPVDVEEHLDDQHHVDALPIG